MQYRQKNASIGIKINYGGEERQWICIQKDSI